ncbi:type II secretion system F family protein [Rothia sp. LK2588]|uniref:type II secretion system F family protein n=1 Tax=Rothia sp. LK2588 TaxID=3114369 RepID=UPI0034CD46DE
MRFFRTRTPPPQPPVLSSALLLELTAQMLGAGLSVTGCLQNIRHLDEARFGPVCGLVVQRLHAGATWEQAWDLDAVPAELQEVSRALALMNSTGAPSAHILQVLAARHRRHGLRATEKSAVTLGVKLVVPLGLCSLPAFVCLGVIPVLISLVPHTLI